MPTRYSIRHITRFNYDVPVSESLMEVRMQPRTEGTQRCLRFELAIAPRAEPVCGMSARDVRHAVHDRWCAVHVSVRPRLPCKASIFRADRIQIRIVGADEHLVSGDNGGRFDFRCCLECPERPARSRIDRVQHACEVADVDRTVGDGRRRFTDPVF